MKKILCFIFLLFLCGMDGSVGTTSTATVNISITIAPRIDSVYVDKEGHITTKGNIDPDKYDIVVMKETKNTKIIIYIPKL